MNRRLLALPLALAALAAGPAVARAATVDNTGDDAIGDPVNCLTPGNCHLRDAVAGGGTVDFAPGLGPIQLTSTLTVGSSGVTISDPQGDVSVGPSGSVDPLVDFTAGNALVQGVTFTNPGGTAIKVEDGVTGVKIEKSPIFNVATPIALGTGSNAGIAAPHGLRVGPRQPDGTLPVSGAAPSGARVDIYSGDPTGSTATKFVGAATANGSGAFSFVPNPELAPGTTVTATSTGAGTSRYSQAATVPADVTSPTLATAFAFSTNEVIVIPSEPLAGGSLNLSDFALQMAGVPRPIVQGAVSPDGGRVYLISSQPWNPGEAGGVSMTGPGVLTDAAGNFNTGTSPVLVGAAPGDFQAPAVQNLKLTPSKVCLKKTRRCRHPGVTISFVTNEPGKAVVVVNRASNRRAGEFVKKVVKPGLVKLFWHGTIHGRRLRAGRYVVEVSMEDLVGNVTDSPPFQVIHIVKR
ncbi:MAG TPA: hypothetical protein VJU60_04015 [Thermoleophilaceae bacterium]|nr:hypothetical protein [Thermoleophilaceae bacterium]